jgi:uncharacterized protein
VASAWRARCTSQRAPDLTGNFASASFQDLAVDGVSGVRYLAFVVAVSASGVSPAAQMDFAAAYSLKQSGLPASVVKRALEVRAKVNDYYRGHIGREQAEKAVQAIRQELWFDQVFLPGGGRLPDEPAGTKWYMEMDYDPLPVLARVRVPLAFFFGESDRWVPVDESIARI